MQSCWKKPDFHHISVPWLPIKTAFWWSSQMSQSAQKFRHFQMCHPLTCFHFHPLSSSVCPSVFSPLAVSLDNNNLAHWSHYGIKEGLHENTDHCVGSRALSSYFLQHPHEEKQQRKTRKQFIVCSLTGNFWMWYLYHKTSICNSGQSEWKAFFFVCVCFLGPIMTMDFKGFILSLQSDYILEEE